MPAEPFKIRITGDGAGTLDAVHVTINLFDHAAGDPEEEEGS